MTVVVPARTPPVGHGVEVGAGCPPSAPTDSFEGWGVVTSYKGPGADDGLFG